MKTYQRIGTEIGELVEARPCAGNGHVEIIRAGELILETDYVLIVRRPR